LKVLYAALLFLVYTTISCSGLYLLKAAATVLSVKFFIGGLLYCAGAAMWLVILRLYPLSAAFPIAAGMLILGTTASGYLMLSERISLVQVVGIVFVTTGIVLISIRLNQG
jgi:multidrug transporter EmrE-like cation transporter